MFPGANAAREDAAYVIVGAPLDVSTSFQPGSRFGPDRIRRFAEAFEDYDHHTFQRFSALSVHDHGNVRAWDDAPAYLDFLEGVINDIVRDDAVPLVLGGEHTVTPVGVRSVEPDVYVCTDAHLDLRSEYDGNPLSHATVTHRVLDIVDEVVIIGVRTGSESEWKRAKEPDVTIVPPEDTRTWLDEGGARAESYFNDRTVYLSVDIDSVDPGFAPGTGTKEPFGLTPRELRDIVRLVGPHAVGFDVVEVNDRDDGQAAVLAGKLLREFVFVHATHHT